MQDSDSDADDETDDNVDPLTGSRINDDSVTNASAAEQDRRRSTPVELPSMSLVRGFAGRLMSWRTARGSRQTPTTGTEASAQPAPVILEEGPSRRNVNTVPDAPSATPGLAAFRIKVHAMKKDHS